MAPLGARSPHRARNRCSSPPAPTCSASTTGRSRSTAPRRPRRSWGCWWGARAPIVGVMMEGHDLVEAIAVTDFPVDGAGITAFLADWIRARRFAPALDGVLFGGITLAGLAVLDPASLARELGTPVVVVNRKGRSDAPLRGALTTA